MFFLLVVIKVLVVFSSVIGPYWSPAATARADDDMANTPEVCSTVEVLVLMDLEVGPASSASFPPSAEVGGMKVLTLINYNKLRRFYTQLTRLDGLDLVQFSFWDGQTLSVPSPAISDGLNSYKFVSFHFHWGTDSLHGSVHLIDGQKFAMELHSVHLSDKYEKIADGLNTEPDRDGRGPPFLVIVVLINTIESAPHNPNFERIVKSLRRANNSATGRFHTDPKYGRLNLFNLLPKSLRNFGMDPPQQMATYYGPRGHRFGGCGKKNETAACSTKYSAWLVFKEPIILAEAQLEPFWNLYNADGRLVGLSPFPEEKLDIHDPQEGKKNLGFSLHE